MAIRNELFKKVQSITNKGLEIMEGRESGDVNEILNTVVTVDNYQIGETKEGKYVAFTIKDNEDEFFFGGSVITDNFISLDNILTEDEKAELLNEGIEILITSVKSENKRIYKKCTFFPNN